MADHFDLATRLQNLPQELYDHIYNYTLDSVDYSTVEITTSYKPPTCIQVSRETRATLVPRYYRNTTFEIGDSSKIVHYSLVLEWLRSLQREHLTELRSVMFMPGGPHGFPKEACIPPAPRPPFQQIVKKLPALGMILATCKFLRLLVHGRCYGMQTFGHTAAGFYLGWATAEGDGIDAAHEEIELDEDYI